MGGEAEAGGCPGNPGQPCLGETQKPATETLSQRKKTLYVVLWVPHTHAHTFTVQPHVCLYLNIHEHIYIHMEKTYKRKR